MKISKKLFLIPIITALSIISAFASLPDLTLYSKDSPKEAIKKIETMTSIIKEGKITGNRVDMENFIPRILTESHKAIGTSGSLSGKGPFKMVLKSLTKKFTSNRIKFAFYKLAEALGEKIKKNKKLKKLYKKELKKFFENIKYRLRSDDTREHKKITAIISGL